MDETNCLITSITYKMATADQRKQDGNAAYKKRDFKTALAEYEEAHKLMPDDPSILGNMAAVHLECGKYNDVVTMCEKALALPVCLFCWNTQKKNTLFFALMAI